MWMDKRVGAKGDRATHGHSLRLAALQMEPIPVSGMWPGASAPKVQGLQPVKHLQYQLRRP